MSNHAVKFEARTSAFGKVFVEAHGVPPEPENGFPGAWVLDAVRYVDEPDTFMHEGTRYQYSDDLAPLLDFYERAELELLASEEYAGDRQANAMVHEGRA